MPPPPCPDRRDDPRDASPARRALLAALLALAAPAHAPTAHAAAAACAHERVVATATTVVEVGAATRCLINVERRRRGRTALLAHGQLRPAAEGHARETARRGILDHTGVDGSTLASRVARGGYLRGARRPALAENIAIGSPELVTAQLTVRMWMRSPAHRRNVLDPRFRHVGIGVAIGAPRSTGAVAAYTVVFGRRS